MNIEDFKREAGLAKDAALADLRDQVNNAKQGCFYFTDSVYFRVLSLNADLRYFLINQPQLQRLEYELLLRKHDLYIANTVGEELGADWTVEVSGSQIWARNPCSSELEVCFLRWSK